MQIIETDAVDRMAQVDRLETDTDRENQRLAMLALLRRWGQRGRAFDAIAMDAGFDYLVVEEGSYTGGPLPLEAAWAVEYKRRKGNFTYGSLFVEEGKYLALVYAEALFSAVPLFVAEWDDVVLLWDARRVEGLELEVMNRTDRGLREDRDLGYYVPLDRLRLIDKTRSS